MSFSTCILSDLEVGKKYTFKTKNDPDILYNFTVKSIEIGTPYFYSDKELLLTEEDAQQTSRIYTIEYVYHNEDITYSYIGYEKCYEWDASLNRHIVKLSEPQGTWTDVLE